jgi:acetolactate synthase-1/2/3 large subunit
VGAEPGPVAKSMLDIGKPDIDFVSLSEGLGVPATRAATAEELNRELARAIEEPGPHLVEAMVPSLLG